MSTNYENLKNVTILYCEDEDDLRDVTANILESYTKKLYLAKDGIEGLAIFKEHENEIDLIITDVCMPNMNGIEMSKIIKDINVNVPIIVATAFSNSSYLLEAIELGIDKYILKPIDIRKLFDVISKSLMYQELKDLYKDNLTHLPNRNAIIRDLKVQNYNTIALFDIDDFSTMNELYGDEQGDKILTAFAEKIKNTFEVIDCVLYRVGDDKFAILSHDKNVSQNTLYNITKSFVLQLDLDGLIVENEVIYFGATVAIANSLCSDTYIIALRVLSNAKDKFQQIMQYDKEIHDNSINYLENQKWIKRLKNGLFNGEFQAYYQSIVDIKTNQIYKYEALIRYVTSEGEEISPAIFLPIAKKAKLFTGIVKLMINECFKFIKEKKKIVSVNISFEDIKNKETYNFIINTLQENKEIAHNLHFELLETEEIEDFSLAKRFIEEVKSFGCQVGVDDFGAGYSNFNMLSELKVDFVKIDGSLIRQIDTNNTQEVIVDTISGYTKRTHVKTIAEFVSSENILNKIKTLDINYAQGYYFSAPISFNSID